MCVWSSYLCKTGFNLNKKPFIPSRQVSGRLIRDINTQNSRTPKNWGEYNIRLHILSVCASYHRKTGFKLKKKIVHKRLSFLSSRRLGT